LARIAGVGWREPVSVQDRWACHGENIEMSGVAEAESGLRRWKPLYGPIAGDLDRCEELLRRELSSDDPFVDQLIKHAFRLGGKRLRPALLLLAAKAVGGVKNEHITLAAVVEMIHTATLVHDDVLDEAKLRRHRETVNARNDNEASVLVGDFLFTHAFALASSLGTTYACRTIGRATNIVCAGELRQIHSRGNFALGEAEYLDIIEAKTAELCACCCRLGAHYAGADAEVEESLDRFGRNLGIAFQIVDDLLDVVGDEDLAGKSLGSDLEKQKLTLPVIRLLAEADEAARSEMVRVLQRGGSESRQALANWLAQCDALAYAKAKANWYVDLALRDLHGLPASHARDVLESLTRFVIARSE
jgi:octaprenyl-diphosphate synthase